MPKGRKTEPKAAKPTAKTEEAKPSGYRLTDNVAYRSYAFAVYGRAGDMLLPCSEEVIKELKAKNLIEEVK